MIIFIAALIISFVGTLLLAERGSYIGSRPKQIVALLVNLVAVVLFAMHYGTARGIFVYLGVIAFWGMVITLYKAVKEKQVAE